MSKIIAIETAVFGGGCFWCTEAIFSKLRGIYSVLPGYAGGDITSPTYEDVSGGDTGHTEVVKVEFNPGVVSYQNLLEIFFEIHDPTTLNRQGNDFGPQYRSVIFYSSDEQKNLAEKFITELNESKKFRDPIVTEIKALSKFFPAEESHLEYYEKNKNQPYCQLVISPKLKKLEKKFSEFI